MRYTLFPLKSLSVFSSPQGGIVRSVNFFRFGVLICFEDIFPHLAREFVKDGANFLVNMTNDAWFGDTAAAEQHLQASVFRAIENRVPVIRAANTGVSCFIDPTGEVTGRVTGVSIMRDETADTFVKGFKTERIRICAIRSFYTKNGDFFVFFCGFMILLVFVTEMFFKDKDERKVRGTNTP